MEAIDVKKCICLNEICNNDNDLINNENINNNNNDNNHSSIINTNQAICKLKCGCEIHSSCFVDYIKCRLEDKVCMFTMLNSIIYYYLLISC